MDQKSQEARIDLKNILEFWDLREIANTEEVGVLYRALPSRPVNPKDRESGHKKSKISLKDVLTVFENGEEAPSVVIGPSHSPASFPSHYKVEDNLGIEYYSKRNS